MADTLQSRVQSVKLMEQNRREIVKALNEVGITEAREDTPLSKLTELIRWATGFGGCDVATVELKSGKHRYFKPEAWEGMDADTRSGYISVGIRFRAEARQWIIAKSEIAGGVHRWADQGQDIPGLPNYELKVRSNGLLDDYNGRGKTATICNYAEATGVAHPAAQKCRAYKAAEGDTTEWWLPDASEWKLMNRYRLEIDAALTRHYNTKMRYAGYTFYWTSDEYNLAMPWVVQLREMYYSTNSQKHHASNFSWACGTVEDWN